MSDALTADMFVSHIGRSMSLPDGRTLMLIAVDRSPGTGHGSAPRAPFSLLLRGQPAPVVPEGLYRVTLEDGAGFELYLIPVHTPARDHQDYQIVFN
jgi:hypothetical protein